MATRDLVISFLHSIRARLAALVLGVALPLVSLMAYDYSNRLASRITLAEDSARAQADTVAAALAQLIDNERAMLEALAARPAQRIERPAVCDPFLAELIALNPYRANLAVLTEVGDIVCSALPLPPDRTVSVLDREYVQRLLRTGEFTIGEPIQDRIIGRWIVPLAYPRRDATKRLIGWVAVPLDVERIATALARGGAHSDIVTVVSAQGRVITRSKDAVKWVGTDIRDVSHGALTPDVTAILDGTMTAWRAKGLDGIARIWGAAPVARAGWRVLVGVEEAPLLAPATAALWRNSLLVMLVFLLTGALALGIGRAIFKPIQSLTGFLGRIAAGERSLRAALTGATEIDRIATEMNRMLDAIDLSMAALQNAKTDLELAQGVAHIGSWKWNLQTGLVEWSDEMFKLFGVDKVAPHVSLDQIIATAIHPEDRQKVKDNQLAILNGAASKPIEYRVIRGDGAERHLWADGGILEAGDSGKSPILRGVVQDITERKISEQALGESRARLEALTRRLLEVQEVERRMIARELHDEVGGVLTAVKLNLQSMRRAHTDAQREAALADGLALVDGAVQSVRSLSLDLRPAMLDDLGLIPALKWYCQRQAQRAGVVIELAFDAIDLQAAAQLETACFRIVQEALTNALRHAQAQRIKVALRRSDGHFVIEICDDGIGFDAQAARARGLAGESYGLLGMAERVSLLGGRFGVESMPGCTRVWAEFSLPDEGFT